METRNTYRLRACRPMLSGFALPLDDTTVSTRESRCTTTPGPVTCVTIQATMWAAAMTHVDLVDQRSEDVRYLVGFVKSQLSQRCHPLTDDGSVATRGWRPTPQDDAVSRVPVSDDKRGFQRTVGTKHRTRVPGAKAQRIVHRLLHVAQTQKTVIASSALRVCF